jgi:hypothetical protein
MTALGAGAGTSLRGSGVVDGSVSAIAAPRARDCAKTLERGVKEKR